MTLENLIRYEPAAVARNNAEHEPGLAIIAMENFYLGLLQEDDPIISRALQDATAGIKAGVSGISNSGVAQAIAVYDKKYRGTFENTKILDLITYLSSDSYRIPDVVTEGLKAYSEFTLLELSEKAELKDTSEEEKRNMAKAVGATGILRDRKLRGATMGIVNDTTTKNLLALYDENLRDRNLSS